MYAFELPNLRFSLPAAATIPPNRFVVANTDSAAALAGADAIAIGVSMNKAEAGQALEIADGLVPVEASAAIAAGASVSTAADGKAATASESTVVGIAITAATAAGQFVTVKLV